MKQVGIAELKSRLSEHLRRVRKGHSLVVLDRDTPIARLVPYDEAEESLPARRPVGRYPTLQDVPLPAPPIRKVDVVELLLEERQGSR
jgi:prevent-host-death family protein